MKKEYRRCFMARILIVDDDTDIVESLKTVLESAGHSTIIALTGEQGKVKAAAEKPDIIVLDVMMESIDKGFEVSRSLKKAADTKNIPIIMITAIKEIADMNLTSLKVDEPSGGTSDYLPVDILYEKPLDPGLLLRKVDALLAKK
jgi:CheY-like chemotaxis protein